VLDREGRQRGVELLGIDLGPGGVPELWCELEVPISRPVGQQPQGPVEVRIRIESVVPARDEEINFARRIVGERGGVFIGNGVRGAQPPMSSWPELCSAHYPGPALESAILIAKAILHGLMQRMSRVLWSSVLVVAIAGCGRRDIAVLHPEAKQVVLSSGMLQDCENLGDVSGKSTAEGDPEAAMQGARNDLRNRVAALGGTHGVIETSVSDMKVGVWRGAKEIVLSGTAYRCPPKPPSTEATPAAEPSPAANTTAK
jgi:hypothetical protein